MLSWTVVVIRVSRGMAWSMYLVRYAARGDDRRRPPRQALQAQQELGPLHTIVRILPRGPSTGLRWFRHVDHGRISAGHVNSTTEPRPL